MRASGPHTGPRSARGRWAGEIGPRAAQNITACGVLLLHLALAACADIDGTHEGAACNPEGVCVPGLICEEGICKNERTVTWERMNRPESSTLYAVWGTDDKNLFAAGASGRVLRYTGSGLDWIDTKQDASSQTLYDIWGSGPGNIWFVGNKTILHFDGKSWASQIPLDTDSKEMDSFSLKAIHGAGGHIYAVGSRSYPSSNLVLRYTGGTWREVDGTGLGFAPNDVWVSADGKVFIVGDALHVKHFDGSGWREQNLNAQEPVKVNTIWGRDPSVLHAAGESGALLTYHEGSWILLSGKRGSYEARDIWGVSDWDLFIVGDGSSYGGSGSGIERCAGTCAANPMPDGVVGTKLKGVWASPDGSTVYTVGGGGVILRRKMR